MKRALHLLRHTVRPLAGFLLAHWICCWLDFFSAEDWKEQMASNRTSVHLSLLTGCVVAWMAGYAVRFRPRESSYFVQPVSYVERLGIQVVTVLVIAILGPLMVQWMVIGGADVSGLWWRLRYALHHGLKDYLLVGTFFITGLLGLSWLRALLLTGISYWLAYSCLLVFEFLDLKRVDILLHWGLLWGLGLVGFAVWKQRVELTGFRLSILGALSVIGISMALTYGDHLWLDKQVSALVEETFEKYPQENAYTMRVVSSTEVITITTSEKVTSGVLKLLPKRDRLMFPEGAVQQPTWAWRSGTDQPWSATDTSVLEAKPFDDFYQLRLNNTRSEPVQLQDGQIKLKMLVEFSLFTHKTDSETETQYYAKRMVEGPCRRASRWLDFVIDHVTITLPGIAQTGPTMTKNAFKSRSWNDGVKLRLAAVDPNHLPENVIELADYVQHHSAEEIAPLVTKWLPELLQLLEMEVGIDQITPAIEKAATEEHKAQIIAKVPLVPQLTSVLLAKGWLMEAKREVIASTELIPSRSPGLLKALIAAGDKDFYPLIHRILLQDERRPDGVPDLIAWPGLRDYLWEHRSKRFEIREGQRIWSLLLKSGSLPALIECLRQRSFWAGEFLRDDHLQPLQLDKSTIEEIQKHQDRLSFHPSLKIFIYTKPAVP